MSCYLILSLGVENPFRSLIRKIFGRFSKVVIIRDLSVFITLYRNIP